MSTQCFPSCCGLKGSLVVHAASHGVTAAVDITGFFAALGASRLDQRGLPSHKALRTPPQ